MRPAVFLRFERLYEAIRMAYAGVRLALARHGDRRAHLGGHRPGEVLAPGFGEIADADEEREAVRLRPAPEFLESRHRCLRRAVDISRAAEGNGADFRVCRRVHDRHRVGAERGDPVAADIEAFGLDTHSAATPLVAGRTTS